MNENIGRVVILVKLHRFEVVESFFHKLNFWSHGLPYTGRNAIGRNELVVLQTRYVLGMIL